MEVVRRHQSAACSTREGEQDGRASKESLPLPDHALVKDGALTRGGGRRWRRATIFGVHWDPKHKGISEEEADQGRDKCTEIVHRDFFRIPPQAQGYDEAGLKRESLSSFKKLQVQARLIPV